MRVISKPPPLNEQVTFDWFLTTVLNRDQRFNSTGHGIRAAVRIEGALTKSEDTLSLEEPDYALLTEAVENPALLQHLQSQPVYPVESGARVLLPFLDAVREAKQER